MASLALGIAGTALGGSIGGTIFGLSAAAVGGMVGSAVGSVVDSMILASMMPDQRIEGQRLESLSVTTSTEGAVLPRVHGRMKVGGNIIWATDFREEITEEKQGGGKGGGPSVTTVTYRYYVSFAVALCEGPITGIGRIWADGDAMDLTNATYRVYLGSEDQEPDTFMESKIGAGKVPAYRGTAYIVFEDILLEDYGNRIPQLSIEVLRPLADDDVAEGMVRAVTMIPGTGEFVYATQPVSNDLKEYTLQTIGLGGSSGDSSSENRNADRTRTDFLEAVDSLQASIPGIESVSLVVSWFGDDLRGFACQLRPGVEVGGVESAAVENPLSQLFPWLPTNKFTSRLWSVNGIGRADAHLVGHDSGGRPMYGGTPADFSVVEAIQELKSRGLRVTFYPFILMDIADDNTLPDPYSDNASTIGQPAHPWRGRITCSPAAGYDGSIDQTFAAQQTVTNFFGDAEASDFTIQDAETGPLDWREPVWTGDPNEWSFRRMILHYAHLCAENGGVDSFLIGSEMPGITTIRDGVGSYPGVDAFVDLAAEVSAILGSGTDVSYAADWTEYFGHHPADGSGDVYFHLDPLWASPHVDFVGIDNYMPLSDWRDGFDHLDAQAWPNIYDRGYLQSNVEGGEGFDWYYASASDRTSQVRTPISDGAAGKPWVFRYKDLRSWWSNQHYNRPDGVEAGSPTAWVPGSKPFRFTEFGCPAVDRGPNQPNVFYDPKSSESFVPYFSRGWRDDAVQRAYLEAFIGYWADDANNPAAGSYSGRMVDMGEAAAWTWDARPYPFFPALEDVWSDGANWRLGHWLNGRLGAASLRALVRDLCLRAGMDASEIDVEALYGAVEGYTVDAIESARASISICASHFGFDATESLGRIKFQPRGQAPVKTLALADLLAGDNGEPITFERAQETELPQSLKWNVLRSDEDYNQATTEARRRVVKSSRTTTESFPLAVPPEEAARRVERSLQERWTGRETSSFGLPPSQIALDPTDVVEISHDGRLYPVRLQSIRDNEARNIEAILQDRLAYDLPPGPTVGTSLARATVFGAAQLRFLNLPQLRADHPAYQPLLAAYAAPWPGDMAVYRSPSEDGFSLLRTFSTRAQFAVTAAAFEAGPTSRFDLANELLIDVSNGTLTSVTDLQLFDGENSFAVETATGVWEIVQAGQIDLVAEGQYRLTRLLRGQRGTEGAMVPTLAAGAQVIVLGATLANLPINESDVGIPYNWRVGPATLTMDEDAFTAAAFTPTGRGLQPFSPCHVRQPYLRGRTTGDLSIEWIRRSRDLGADSWAAADVPLAEDVESYEVDIMDGSTVLRTLSASSPSVTYTEAQQVTDFGAALGPGDTVDIRVAQLSTVYGRGAVTYETLIF